MSDVESGTRLLSSSLTFCAPCNHIAVTDSPSQTDFVLRLYAVYVDLHFAYLEINPLVVLDPKEPGGTPTVHFLDTAAKLDQTAESIVGQKWAIARDESVILGQESKPVVGGKVQADRGPPMVSCCVQLAHICG